MEKLLLLVDDEPLILKSLKRLFHSTDYTVLTANCAYQALDIIREKPIAVVISDYTMPDLSGAELLAMAKALRPDIYAVILSGNGDQQSVIRSINEGGAAKFITKPWADQDLIATVDTAYATWLDQHYSLQIPDLLNQNFYLQHLHEALGHPYLNDYIIVCFELQDLREIQHYLNDRELRELFMALILESGVTDNHDDTTIALLNDGRLSACLKLSEQDNRPDAHLLRFLERFPKLISFRGYQLPIRFNVGFTVSSRFCHNGELLLKNASIALDQPENSETRQSHLLEDSGSRLIQFEPGMVSRLTTQLSKTSRLYSALERGEFSIDYQPKIQLPDNIVCGAEALLRWHCPELGAVSPEEFIPVAEEYGLISEIGDWVLQTAATQWTSTDLEWARLASSGATLSVNVSSIQLADSRFISRFAAAVNASKISPELLELEITESALIQNMNAVAKVLTHIRELGVKISIDDFGTGYSSLSYLNKLPIDIIKIDRSFVGAMFQTKSGTDLVRNLISLGKDIGHTIVAEGVEEQRQIDLLTRFGCSIFQGFYFSRPLPAHQFEQFMAERNQLAMHRRAS